MHISRFTVSYCHTYTLMHACDATCIYVHVQAQLTDAKVDDVKHEGPENTRRTDQRLEIVGTWGEGGGREGGRGGGRGEGVRVVREGGEGGRKSELRT